MNLGESMAVCDANYIRLLKLLPGMGLHCSRELWLYAPGPGYHGSCRHLVVLAVIEVLRYTTTVSITLVPETQSPAYFQPPAMLVRLYHDADTAEVVRYQDKGAFHLRARPGDSPEFSIDEKQQVNAFLAEWLALCMEQGMGSNPMLADMASID